MTLVQAVYFTLIGFGTVSPKSLREDSFAGKAAKSCGHQACHPTYPDKLNVHLIPHSHDDVGWLKTVDQYFYGARNYELHNASVYSTISSTIVALQANPERRYIQVETAFFWKWWKTQSQKTKQIVRNLINSGQLEILNGAWSMNDEAITHYTSIIDSFTLGLRTINDTLGLCGHTSIGWQIDPFGHSNSMATIFKSMGYEAIFFARIHMDDEKRRKAEKALEMFWQGSKNLGPSSNIFAHVFSNFYMHPSYFCWDVVCGDVPMIDDEDSPEYNVPQRVADFAKIIEEHSAYFQTHHLLINMGGDFTYPAALMYFTNIDRLIEGFKRFRPGINVIYSTPSCYLKAVNDYANQHNVSFEVKTDDFFPYANRKNAYWSGYYTSRPNSKRLERIGNNILQASKQLTSFQITKNLDYSTNLTALKEIMGVMQHHDAITGTEKQHVAQDYVRLLTKGVDSAQDGLGEIISGLLKFENYSKNEVPIVMRLCLLVNVTHCKQSNAEKFTVAVYNPLGKHVSHYVRLPVNSVSFKITGPDGVLDDYDVLEPIANFSYVHNIQPSKYDLVFLAEDTPPLGIKYYYVAVTKNKNQNIPNKRSNDIFYLGTDTTGFAIDESTGLLKSITTNSITINVTQEFLYYNGANGTNLDGDQASGAYVFRPAGTTREAKSLSDSVTYEVVPGKLVDEVHQTFRPWIKQIIRVYKKENHVEFDWLVGPVELINNLGTEIITRFTTDLNTDEKFYTDSNGKETIERIRNYAKTYNYTDEEPVAGNYYPVTSRISIRDIEKNLELTVFTDRGQGGSSLKDGVLELMVHRRLLCDDDLGVQEALNEMEFGQGVVARGQHYVTVGNIKSASSSNIVSSAELQKDIANRKLLAPLVLVGDATAHNHSLEHVQKKQNFSFSGLRRSLPKNVHLLTLEPWKDNALLMRFEHVYEVDEHPELSGPVTFNVDEIFTFNISKLRETTLGANRWIDELPEKLEWNFNKNYSESEDIVNCVDDLSIIILPSRICTFVAWYNDIDD